VLEAKQKAGKALVNTSFEKRSLFTHKAHSFTVVMKHILSAIHDDQVIFQTAPNPQHLVRLVDAVRPPRYFVRKRRDVAVKRVRQLLALLHEYPVLRTSLSEYIRDLFASADYASVYAESGLQSQSGFFSEGMQKITQWLLPPLYDSGSVRGLLNMVFHQNDDYVWFDAVPQELWAEVLALLDIAQPTTTVNVQHGAYHQLLNALVMVSHKVAAMGLEPEILERLPEMDSLHSPFVQQHREIVRYVEFIRTHNIYPTDDESRDDDHALVMLTQCEDCINTIRKNRAKFGASLRLTYQMQRIMQHIQRLKTMLRLTVKPDINAPDKLALLLGQFVKELVRAENTKHKLSKHVNDNIGLLAFQVAENAAKTGEHYITVTRKEYQRFFLSALGGGVIVGFLALFKLLWYYCHFPPFGEALAYGLNYALGFVLIHLLGCTLATKQPAMTASVIAESLDSTSDTKKQDHRRRETASEKRRDADRKQQVSLQDLVVMISRISRSQLIAFVGNVMAAFPVGLAIGSLWLLTGEPLANAQKAEKMLAELHPFTSLSLWYAAIAGVFLFTAGLISGYYDNKVVVSHLPERLCHHPLLKRLMAKHTLGRFSKYIENNLGALAGNFSLGMFLGFSGMIGFIFGLPIDIRHITFAAANVGLALASLKFQIAPEQIAWSFAGVVGIGAMNFLVSFSLALFVALRSRRVNFRQTAELLSLLWNYFRRHTSEFFFPPRTARPLEQH
jgi:site-specific recombinase